MKGAKTALMRPIRMKRRRSLWTRAYKRQSRTSNVRVSRLRGNSRFDELLLVSLEQECPPDLAIATEKKAHQTKAEVPLERLGQHPLAQSSLPLRASGLPPRQKGRQGDAEVQDVLVEEGDEVVLFSHDAVGDVVGI